MLDLQQTWRCPANDAALIQSIVTTIRSMSVKCSVSAYVIIDFKSAFPRCSGQTQAWNTKAASTGKRMPVPSDLVREKFSSESIHPVAIQEKPTTRPSNMVTTTRRSGRLSVDASPIVDGQAAWSIHCCKLSVVGIKN